MENDLASEVCKQKVFEGKEDKEKKAALSTSGCPPFDSVTGWIPKPRANFDRLERGQCAQGNLEDKVKSGAKGEQS